MRDIAVQPTNETDPNLLRMLDRGLDDIEAGRVLTHEEAVKEIRNIRQRRREERSIKYATV